MTIHEDTRVDNYYWLNQRENPKVIEYLEAENAYKDVVMKHTEPLQEKLFDEIIGRIKQNHIRKPVFGNISQHLVYQITMGIEYSHTLAVLDILNDHV